MAVLPSLKGITDDLCVDTRSLPDRIKARLSLQKSLADAKKEAMTELTRTSQDFDTKLRELEAEIDRCSKPEKLLALSCLLVQLRTFVSLFSTALLNFLRLSLDINACIDWLCSKLSDLIKSF